MDSHATADLPQLAHTQFHIPSQPSDVLPRPRLVHALHQALTGHRLTLLSAPAGYGKTTLLAALPEYFPNLPVAWLSLDEGHDDPVQFLAAVIVALHGANRAVGATARAILADLISSTGRASAGENARRVIAALVNDVLAAVPEPFALVLDDLHRVGEPSVYLALDYLLERLPAPMHLAVGSRYDPPLALARLRARGQLAEMRLRDLRFAPEEGAAWLRERLRRDLSSDELVAFETAAEGWPAGLRLLALSLEQRPTASARAEFLSRLPHTDRFLFDFLAQEVLDHQPASLRAFLLETSLLPELTPPLCRAITGQDNAEALLEEVGRRNLLTQVVGPNGDTLRYHPLFAEFLRRRLALEAHERVSELHRRAAAAENLPARAISHYLAAQLWEEAADAIEQGGELIARNGLVDTLRGWIEALPPAVRDRRPWLLYYLGLSALVRGALDEASTLLLRAREGFAAVGHEAGQGLCLLELVSVANSQFDYERQAVFTQQALAYPLPPHGRVQLLMARAYQSEYQGKWNEVEADVDEAMRITLASGDSRALIILATILRLDFTLLPNGPDRLEEYCRQVLARFGEVLGPVQAGAFSLLGFIHFLRGHVDEAVQEAERALAMAQQLGGSVYLEGEAGFVLSYAAAVRGDYSAAASCWETRLPQMEHIPAIAPFTAPILFLIGRAYWSQGLLERARQCYDRICTFSNSRELPEAVTTRAHMQALLEISAGRYADAERALRPAVATEKAVPHCVIFGYARLLLAHLYLRWNRPRDALSELVPVLAECERNGTPGWILKEGAVIVVPLLRLAIERGVHSAFAASLLHLLGQEGEPRPVRVPRTGETLTPREVEVVRLIAAGASNQDIATQLVISKHTVKVHVTNILAKLGASSRTQAVARAREMRLI